MRKPTVKKVAFGVVALLLVLVAAWFSLARARALSRAPRGFVVDRSRLPVSPRKNRPASGGKDHRQIKTYKEFIKALAVYLGCQDLREMYGKLENAPSVMFFRSVPDEEDGFYEWANLAAADIDQAMAWYRRLAAGDHYGFRYRQNVLNGIAYGLAANEGFDAALEFLESLDSEKQREIFSKMLIEAYSTVHPNSMWDLFSWMQFPPEPEPEGGDSTLPGELLAQTKTDPQAALAALAQMPEGEEKERARKELLRHWVLSAKDPSAVLTWCMENHFDLKQVYDDLDGGPAYSYLDMMIFKATSFGNPDDLLAIVTRELQGAACTSALRQMAVRLSGQNPDYALALLQRADSTNAADMSMSDLMSYRTVGQNLAENDLGRALAWMASLDRGQVFNELPGSFASAGMMSRQAQAIYGILATWHERFPEKARRWLDETELLGEKEKELVIRQIFSG